MALTAPERSVAVESINTHKRILILEDGTVHAIASFVDHAGDECALEDATYATARIYGGWICFNLSDFTLLGAPTCH